MFNIIFAVHIIICLSIVALVLIQQGKGAEAGAVFGSNSDSVLGAAGAPSFIARLTTAAAIAFMITSVLLVKQYMGQGTGNLDRDLLEGSGATFTQSETVTSEATPSEGDSVAAGTMESSVVDPADGASADTDSVGEADQAAISLSESTTGQAEGSEDSKSAASEPTKN